MQVGVIGVGLMGHGIARNVMRRGGFSLSFMEHPGNQPVDELRALGALSCASAAEVAATSDVLILCVTDSVAVEQVLTAPTGALPALREGAIIVDCSTAQPTSTLRMAALAAAAGGRFLDAPMTRTAQHAHEGTLNLLVGGDEATLRAARPVLASFAENIQHVGPIGAGHRMKLLHNYVSIGFLTLLSEAAAHAADAGIDPQKFVDVLAAGGGGGVALERLTPFLTAGDASGLPFALKNAVKDIGYYREMASIAGAERRVAESVEAALESGLARTQTSDPETMLPELARLLRQQRDQE